MSTSVPREASAPLVRAAVALVNDTAAAPLPIPRLVLDAGGLPVAAPSSITSDQPLAQLARDAIDVLAGN